MIYFILGFSITLNIVSIVLIIFGYKYIKNNLFVPKVEDVTNQINDFFDKYDWLTDKELKK